MNAGGRDRYLKVKRPKEELMAIVKPFRAIRPDAACVREVAALPYDVYSRAEAREAVAGHPLSFLNID